MVYVTETAKSCAGVRHYEDYEMQWPHSPGGQRFPAQHVQVLAAAAGQMSRWARPEA